jgi:hypothetical protein
MPENSVFNLKPQQLLVELDAIEQQQVYGGNGIGFEFKFSSIKSFLKADIDRSKVIVVEGDSNVVGIPASNPITLPTVVPAPQ